MFAIREFKSSEAPSFVIEKPFSLILKHNIAVTSSFMVDRDTLLKSGLYDTAVSIAEDLDLFLRIALQGAWGCSSVPLVNYYRREETEKSLSQQFHINKIKFCEAVIYLLDKIKNISCLSKEEKSLLVNKLSERYYLYGYYLKKTGNKREAENCFVKYLKLNNTLKAKIKYTLALMPFSIGFLLLKQKSRLNRKRYHI